MSEQDSLTKESWITYDQSEGVLLQFILSEFLSTHKQLANIEKLYRQLEAQLVSNRLNSDGVQEQLLELYEALTSLTHSALSVESHFPWSADIGSLTKLRRFCFRLSARLSDTVPASANLGVCVSKGFHSVIQAREVIVGLQPGSSSNRGAPNFPGLYQFIDKFLDNMRRASRLILQLLMSFNDDENVILFLLKNQESFEKVYRPKILSKLFSKMYKNGITEAKDFLINSFSGRGFDHLLPQITQQLRALET